MKKTTIKIFSAVLSVIALFSAVGCKPNSNPNEGNEGNDITYTDKYVVINGVSPYKIVIPEDADKATTFAGEEFKNLFKEATGAVLPIVKDSDVQSGDKYISIGETAQWEESGLTVSEELGVSGLGIYTKDANQYLIGGGQSGTCYAVYEWFERLFDLKYFTQELHTIDSRPTMKLAAFNFIEKPDVPIRFFNYNAYDDIKNVVRLRLNTAAEGLFMYGMGHSFSAIISPSKYGASHPEWFSPNVQTALSGEGNWQLCTSNPELREECFKNICIEFSKPGNENLRYVTVAQNDGGGMCACEGCTAQLNQYGSYGGVYIDFMNWLAERITPWVEENLPNRTVKDPVKVLTFAYSYTDKPPYIEDDPSTPEDESKEPTIKARDDVALYFAPVTMNNAYPFNDEVNNPNYYRLLQQWKKVTKEFSIFNYTHSVASTLQPYNYWNSIRGNIEGMLSVGCNFWFDERESSTESNLTVMGDYVISKMLWDTDSDINELIDDFMLAYYGPEAAPHIREYFDTMQVHFLAADEERGGRVFSWVAHESGNALHRDYFPFNFIGHCYQIFENAYAANEKLKGTNPNYENYAYRIRVEQLVPEYLYIWLWLDQFSYEDASAMIDKFEKYALPTTRSTGWITDQGSTARFIEMARAKL